MGLELHRVPVGQIEQELRQMWSRPGESRIRACALNLVVVGWEERPELIRTLREVTTTHPARTILARVEATEQEGIESRAGFRCLDGPSGARVCQEEIRLSLRGEAMRHLDNVVLSLLVPDVPRFLWWDGPLPQEPVGQRIFGNLAEQCQRLVMDSQRLEESLELVAMAQLTRSEDRRAYLGDLNWHRLTGWRQLIGAAFEPAEMRPRLARLQRVEIERGSDGVQPLLLLGWLGSRLGWAPRRPRPGQPPALWAGDRAVEISIGAGSGRNLRRVALVDEAGAVVEVVAGEDSLGSSVHVPGRPALSHAAPVTTELGAVLTRELGILNRNPVFEAALQLAEVLQAGF